MLAASSELPSSVRNRIIVDCGLRLPLSVGLNKLNIVGEISAFSLTTAYKSLHSTFGSSSFTTCFSIKDQSSVIAQKFSSSYLSASELINSLSSIRIISGLARSYNCTKLPSSRISF
jgi:hypothetical protein